MLKFLLLFLINKIHTTTECQNMNNLDSITRIEIQDIENKRIELDKGEENSSLLSQDEFKVNRNNLNNVVIEFEDSKEESVIGPSAYESTETIGDTLINLDMNQVYNETMIKDIALKNIEHKNFFWKHFAKFGGLAGLFILAIILRDLLTDYFCLKLETSKKAKICLTIILSVLTLLICIGSS
jgi:hypothetical protein